MLIKQFKKYITLESVIAYSTALILCGIVLIWAFELWETDLHVPFSYFGDALDYAVRIKGIIDTGWVLENSYLGMPYGHSLVSIPLFNSLNYAIIKGIAFIVPDFALTMNIWYLLTFPFTTIITMAVLRQFKIPYPYAIVGGLLYTFTPFHFLRGETHLDFSSYFLIPLLIMVVLWIFEEKPILFQNNTESGLKEERSIIINTPTILSIIVCLLISCIDIYYAYYSCFFLLITGIIVSVSAKKRYPLISSLILITIIVIGVTINGLPTIISQQENGNALKGLRPSAESEILGLKIIQIMMPVEGHRIQLFSEFSEYYANTAPLVNENIQASLGIIGSLGFIMLIFWFFYRIAKKEGIHWNNNLRLLNSLSGLTLAALLLSTIGGFGAFFSYTLPMFSLLRGYNRISIFIAFFSIFAFILMMKIGLDRLSKMKYYKIICIGALASLLIFGVFDQTPAELKVFRDDSLGIYKSYDTLKHEYYSDQYFVHQIETNMPDNSMVFQLPYMPYPWWGAINKIQNYDLFKGYLHSHHLRWSYGAMNDEKGDLWQREVSQMNPADMLKIIAFAGFNGVYIDNFGYKDNGTFIISTISGILDTKPIVSNDSRLYFFDMTDYNKKILSHDSMIINYPFRLAGGYDPENWSGINTQWMNDNTTLVIYSSENRSLTLHLNAIGFNHPKTLEIYERNALVSRTTVPTWESIPISSSLTLDKGENIIRFHVVEPCDKPGTIPELNNSDMRCLNVAIQNITLTY